jgi:hypothetical protein
MVYSCDDWEDDPPCWELLRPAMEAMKKRLAGG